IRRIPREQAGQALTRRGGPGCRGGTSGYLPAADSGEYRVGGAPGWILHSGHVNSGGSECDGHLERTVVSELALLPRAVLYAAIAVITLIILDWLATRLFWSRL